ncbi:MAG: IPT/TIG domain-containing protein, partial [Planctomycetota bacterium]
MTSPRATARVLLLWGCFGALLLTCTSSRRSPSPPPSTQRPFIQNVTPPASPMGAAVKIEGTGFGNAPGDLHLAGQPVPPGEVFAWSDTGIHCWVPPGALSGDLVVQTAGISSNGFPFTVTGPDPTPPQRTRAGWNGALSGNFVVLSPGHGTYYHTNLNAWTTQRPDCWGLIEDRHTCEIAVDFLIPMLERAGARVFSCRERSRQTFEGILDEGVGL